MQKVLPLKKWESHKLPEREHFSDQDSEDESEEYISDEEIAPYQNGSKKASPNRNSNGSERVSRNQSQRRRRN